MQVGRIEMILIAEEAEASATALDLARAVAGCGLEGDRYFEGAGTFSDTPGSGRHLTLIESEALANVAAETGIELRAAEARRNLVTSGVALNDLVGKRFTVGEVECVGRRLCEPCAHLERITRPGVLKAFVHRGGLRADIAVGGKIRVGDELRELP